MTRTEATFASFFAGIGGLDLGLERAGHRCVCQVELSEFCRDILATRFPTSVIFGDINHVSAEDIPLVDMWTAGFPCQDISNAGKGIGIHGERTGLFFKFMELVGDVRPRIIVLENVAALLGNGMGEVLGALASCGYDAEWCNLFAASFGAPHLRERIFVVAYPAGKRQSEQRLIWPDPYNNEARPRWETTDALDAIRRGSLPALCRSSHGVPRGVDRCSALGNAVVPAVGEYIGRCVSNLMGELNDQN